MAGFVNGASDQLLTGAGFALNEHRRVNFRNQIYLIKQGAEFALTPINSLVSIFLSSAYTVPKELPIAFEFGGGLDSHGSLQKIKSVHKSIRPEVPDQDNGTKVPQASTGIQENQVSEAGCAGVPGLSPRSGSRH